MKYMLLIYAEEGAWTEPERQACRDESGELARQLAAQDRFIAASPLQPVATATSVSVRQGRRMVTDGPFAETREQLGGFLLIDVPDLDEAIAFAGRLPAARKGTVEIRPLVELLEPRQSPSNEKR